MEFNYLGAVPLIHVRMQGRRPGSCRKPGLPLSPEELTASANERMPYFAA